MKAHKKFSIAEILFLASFSLVFEAAGFLPGLNILTTIIEWAVVVVTFHFKGVSFFGNKKILATSGIAAVIGLIPVISMLPEFIIALAINIHEVNKSAKASIELQGEVEISGRPNRVTRMVGQNATQSQVSIRSSQIERDSMQSFQNERPQRSIQFAKTYTPATPRRDRVLSASGAMLKNEERNS